MSRAPCLTCTKSPTKDLLLLRLPLSTWTIYLISGIWSTQFHIHQSTVKCVLSSRCPIPPIPGMKEKKKTFKKHPAPWRKSNGHIGNSERYKARKIKEGRRFSAPGAWAWNCLWGVGKEWFQMVRVEAGHQGSSANKRTAASCSTDHLQRPQSRLRPHREQRPRHRVWWCGLSPQDFSCVWP